MILVDFNQTVISNVSMEVARQPKNQPPAKLDIGIIRHFVLNALRSYRHKFKEYGELVVCCDAKNYWRKEVFPPYKHSRKGKKDASPIDWDELYTILDALKAEISEHLPYRLLDVETAEADDIIAVLCSYISFVTANAHQIMIVSGDKDFRQLQKYPNVKQFSPVARSYIEESDPAKYLAEQIMSGDSSDGVPNFLSDDDTFMVEGKRQKKLGETGIEKWKDRTTWTPEMVKNWERNRQLIDLTKIPHILKAKIVREFEGQKNKRDRSKLMGYFITKKLNNLMQNIGEF